MPARVAKRQRRLSSDDESDSQGYAQQTSTSLNLTQSISRPRRTTGTPSNPVNPTSAERTQRIPMNVGGRRGVEAEEPASTHRAARRKPIVEESSEELDAEEDEEDEEEQDEGEDGGEDEEDKAKGHVRDVRHTVVSKQPLALSEVKESGAQKVQPSREVQRTTADTMTTLQDEDDDDELSDLESMDEDEDMLDVDGEGEDDDEIDGEGDEEVDEGDEDAIGEDDEDEVPGATGDALGVDEDDEDLSGSDDGSVAAEGLGQDPDLSKLTRRQRVAFTGYDEDMISLSNEAQKKKHLTKEEYAMRRAEMARRRKNLSEKRNEEEKMDTINRLLKKQAPKRRKKADPGEGLAEGDVDEEGAVQYQPSIVFSRFLQSSGGSKLAVPKAWTQPSQPLSEVFGTTVKA